MALKRYDGMRRGVVILPNLLTTANLFCGFYSIIQTLRGNYTFAVWLVVLAGLFDFLDGRVARMTGTQSDFGVEYDSLSDLTTFCMAPAVLVYHWGLSAFDKFGIAASFLYFACGALRLARFNVQSSGVEKSDFQGLPTPAAAGTMVSFILFYKDVFKEALPQDFAPHFLFGLTIFVALLMVSNVRYRSAKKINRRTSFFTLVAIVGIVAVIIARPKLTLFLFGVSYITYGLVGSALSLLGIQRAAPATASGPDALGHDKSHRPFRKRFRKRRHHRHGPDGTQQRHGVESGTLTRDNASANVYPLANKKNEA